AGVWGGSVSVPGAPGPLLCLGCPLVRERVHASVSVGADAPKPGPRRGHAVDDVVVRVAGEVSPQPISRPIEEEEEDHASAHEHQMDCLVWTHSPFQPALSSRAGGIRTPIPRIWSPLLYQFELLP